MIAVVTSVKVSERGAGIPCRTQSSLAQALEPSIRAAVAVGPNARSPRSARASTSPAASGASGPTTVRSIRSRPASSTSPGTSAARRGTHRAIPSIPAFPGAAITDSTDGLRENAEARACSLPPDTTTRTRRLGLHGLVAVGADRDVADRHAPEVRYPLHVLPGRRGEVAVPADGLEVLGPSLEVLVDRLGLVDDGLVRREVLVQPALVPVGHADPHAVEARQHVELRQEELGEAVDPGGVPGQDGVEPSAPSSPAGGGSELLPPLLHTLSGGTGLLCGE